MSRIHRLLVAAITLCLGLSACAQAPMALPEPVPHVTATSDAVSTTVPPTSEPTATAPATTQTPSADATDSATSGGDETTASATATVTEPALPVALIEVGAEGDRVRELQHRLLQIQWYEGDITPTYGEKTQLAVEGFQAKRGLPVLGYVDQATWDRLVAMTKEPTHEEMYNIMVAGPKLLGQGDKGDAVKDLQARLKQIDWFSGDVTPNYGPATAEAVRGFQAKRGIPVTGEVDQRTLDRLYAMTRKPTSDELNNVKPDKGSNSGAFKLDDRCLTGRVVCVSKSQRQLAWVVDGEIKMTMDVRFGSELTPTRNGVFSVSWKSKDHVSSLYHTPMPYALFFSGGQAIHYSADFAARGYNGSSHGCVNVRDKQAVKTLFETVKTGEKVVVY